MNHADSMGWGSMTHPVSEIKKGIYKRYIP